MTVFNRARHLSAGAKTSSQTVGLALPMALRTERRGSRGQAKVPDLAAPNDVIVERKFPVWRDPDLELASTAHVERYNLTMRMSMRRFTRLTNGFSKKVENHCHMLALYYVWHNSCRPHMTLGMTPAMAGGLANYQRDIRWIWGLIEARAPAVKRGLYGVRRY